MATNNRKDNHFFASHSGQNDGATAARVSRLFYGVKYFRPYFVGCSTIQACLRNWQNAQTKNSSTIKSLLIVLQIVFFSVFFKLSQKSTAYLSLV